jgi:hypothetical protein
MEAQGIICKVTEPFRFVSSLVVVEKFYSVKLRICLDPKNLKKAILTLLPNEIGSVLPKLSKEFFTKPDAKSGYSQVI